MTPLCELARKYGTDKGGEHIPYGDVNHCCHVYTPVYWELFKDRIGDSLHLLEIGVSEGYSMRMWREFFPNATLHGWDLSIERFEGEPLSNTRLQRVDQSDVASLIGAYHSADNPLFDIIIDDGSHVFEHQVTTFRTLIPRIAPNGIYVIEDETAPITGYVPPGWSCEVLRWKDPRDMLQVIHVS